jgi:hypothetical protein
VITIERGNTFQLNRTGTQLVCGYGGYPQR